MCVSCKFRFAAVIFVLILFGELRENAYAQNHSSVQKIEGISCRYEVVAVHRNNSDSGDSAWQHYGNVLKMTNEPLVGLVWNAYDDIVTPDQLVGIPRWMRLNRFDIEARMDEKDFAIYKQLSKHDQESADACFLRQFLADRFHYVAHTERKSFPVYDMIVLPKGLRIKPTQSPQNTETQSESDKLIARSITLAGLADTISQEAGRPIKDKTGNTDKFDFTLEWTSLENGDTTLPTLFKALEEQIGVKLVANNSMETIYVVDHIEMPTEN